MSDYYTNSSDPADNSDGDPAVIRAENAAIAAGFAKVAGYTGNGDLPVFINSSGTAQTAVSASSARTKLGLAIGSDVQAYDADLAALAALASTGIIARTGAGTVSARTITGTASEITVTNGDGMSGNPTLSLPSAIVLTGKTVTGLVGASGASLVLIQSQTVSVAVSSVDFTTGIDSTYDSYMMEFVGVRPVSASQALLVQVSENAGGAWKTASYAYNNQQQSAGGTDVSGNSTGSGITSGFVFGDQVSNNAGEGGMCGELWLPNLSITDQKIAHGHGSYLRAASISTSCNMGGQYSGSTGAVTGLRVKFNSGNVAAGSIRLYGVKKS